jgi:hypothetical protein
LSSGCYLFFLFVRFLFPYGPIVCVFILFPCLFPFCQSVYVYIGFPKRCIQTR